MAKLLDNLATLKTGDTVLYRADTLSTTVPVVKVVKKVTPSGRVTLVDGEVFRANGSRVNGMRLDCGYIILATPERLKLLGM